MPAPGAPKPSDDKLDGALLHAASNPKESRALATSTRVMRGFMHGEPPSITKSGGRAPPFAAAPRPISAPGTRG